MLPESNERISQLSSNNVHPSVGYRESREEHPNVHGIGRPWQILQPNYPAHGNVLFLFYAAGNNVPKKIGVCNGTGGQGHSSESIVRYIWWRGINSQEMVVTE